MARSTRKAPRASARNAATPETSERGLKIGEASVELGVESYVLRFWETQFPFLKPRHARTKHRFYQRRDLDVLRLIKRLLHEEGFTIVGANKHIREFGLEALLSGKALEKPPRAATTGLSAVHEPEVELPMRRILAEVRRDLESIQKLLEH
jgi:DNA-binding transcriptional MerR regulator